MKTFTAWENKTQEVIALQNKWKTIGFAPQKMNVKIFERFRHACDDFFKKKGEFFKTMKEGMNENLEKKKALCEKAEALKDSTDWKTTADALTKLQKEWKTIGTKKQSNFFPAFHRNGKHGEKEKYYQPTGCYQRIHGYRRGGDIGSRTDERMEFNRACAIQRKR